MRSVSKFTLFLVISYSILLTTTDTGYISFIKHIFLLKAIKILIGRVLISHKTLFLADWKTVTPEEPIPVDLEEHPLHLQIKTKSDRGYTYLCLDSDRRNCHTEIGIDYYEDPLTLDTAFLESFWLWQTC